MNLLILLYYFNNFLKNTKILIEVGIDQIYIMLVLKITSNVFTLLFLENVSSIHVSINI